MSTTENVPSGQPTIVTSKKEISLVSPVTSLSDTSKHSSTVLKDIEKPSTSVPPKEDDTSAVPGSMSCPYRLAIVGGGPAGTSIIVRAIHLGVVNELCSFGAKRDNTVYNKSKRKGVLKKQAGVCLFDASPPQRFGGGRLQDYVINSNTFGGKFVTNIVQDKPNVLPPEMATGTVLECLDKSPMAAALTKFGTNVAPLCDIGVFLVEIGVQVKKLLDYYRESSRYESNTEVTQIQQSECKSYWKITSINKKTHLMTETYAIQVVLATGGSQKLPRLSPSSRNNKVMSSDDVCTNKGIELLRAKLEKKDKKKIVIIGGSHSAFSAAWICLNKLTNFNSEFQIYIVHRTAVKVFYATKKEADKDKYYDYEAPNKCGQIHPFGGLRGDAKTLYRSIKSGHETKIRMLCTGPDGGNHQTMANKLQEEAHVIIWACGYAANTSFKVLDYHGNTIKLQLDRGQVAVNDLAQVMRDNCTSSKHSQSLPRSSSSFSPVTVSASTEDTPTVTPPTIISATTPAVSPTKQTTVDQISTPLIGKITSTFPSPVGNLLGTGLGYGLSLGNSSSSDETAKADGVAVYLKRGATLILSHVLGPKVFGEKAYTWEQHVAINLKKSTMLNLELQLQEKIQQKESKEQRDNQKASELSAESKTINSKKIVKVSAASPKKSSRNIMLFDPASPSNASTAISPPASTFSPIKRTTSTAPGSSRSRSYNTGSSKVPLKPEGSPKAKRKGSIDSSTARTTSDDGTSNNRSSSRQKDSKSKIGSMSHDNTVPISSSANSTSTNGVDHNECINTSSDSGDSSNSGLTTTSVVVSTVYTADSSANELEGEGVSVLSSSKDINDDPPPTYRSTESAESPSKHALLFPQVPGVTASNTTNLQQKQQRQEVLHTNSSQTQAQLQTCQNETLSRLCQPKSFSRAPHTKKRTHSTKSEVPKVSLKAPKVVSEFIIDLPMNGVVCTQKEFKGSYVKADDALTRLGSENIHMHLLQTSDSKSNALVLCQRSNDSSPSSSLSPTVTSNSRSSQGSTRSTIRQDSKSSRDIEEKNEINSPNAINAWDIQSATCKQPPTSPINKKKPTSRSGISHKQSPSKRKVSTRYVQNNGYENDFNNKRIMEKKNPASNAVCGPSVADILWAEKRNSQQHEEQPSNEPPHTPRKGSSMTSVTHSPIGKPASSFSPTPSSRSRARSSGGCSSGSNSRYARSTSRGQKRQPQQQQEEDEVSRAKSQGKAVRSPLPSSAPARSKRILSQSVDGPSIAQLKLPSLHSESHDISISNNSGGGSARGSGIYSKLIAKPILVVRHDVFHKSLNDIPVD